MSRNRKYYEHNTVLFVSTRIREGLPIVPTHNLNYLIWGILARARALYQTKVCHFVFMSNHIHMLLVVDDPEDTSSFLGYVKSQTTHVINKMLGITSRPIWDDGFDSPRLLDAETTRHYISYIYLNPLRANLVDNVDQYPGVSSWQMFKSGKHTRKCHRIPRPILKALPLPALSISEQQQIVSYYSKIKAGDRHEFMLEPFAWVECFSEEETDSSDLDKHKIISSILDQQRTINEQRTKSKTRAVGATSLRRQSMSKSHHPKKQGQRMICIGRDKDRRKAFIAYYRELCAKAHSAYESWKRGDLTPKIPIGLFAPRTPQFACNLPLIL